jgi:hypothetical protein
MLKIASEQYVFPPRSKNAVPRSRTAMFGELGWKAQFKYNDTRIIVKYCADGKIELWNRHAERLKSYHTPDWLMDELLEVGISLNLSKGTTTMLDGGLLDTKHRLIKDTIVIWDVLVLNNEYLIGTTYQSRYNKILDLAKGDWSHHVPTVGNIKFGLAITEHILTPESHCSDMWDTMWDTIHAINKPFGQSPVIEGLCFKDMAGKLEFASKEDNNYSWYMRSRVATGRHEF